MTRGHQQKRFDARLALKLPAELRAELQAAAKQSGELISDVARRVLTDWATARVVERGAPAANGQNQQSKTELQT
jgi:hypothetical protein